VNGASLTSGRSKPPLLLIHGWGMNPSVWEAMAEPLREHFEVHCPALPGHAGAPLQAGWSVGSVARGWLEMWPDAFWVGWSLGAQVTLAAACRQGAHLRAAVLLGGTPRFVTSRDWSCAMPGDEFSAFYRQCEASPQSTLHQFLGLQVLGSAARGPTLRALRQALGAVPEPRPEALLEGLRVLRDSDLRAALATVDCPVLWLCGERDQLTPVAAARLSAASMMQSQVECLPGAGHAPFISHEAEVLEQINAWFLEKCV